MARSSAFLGRKAAGGVVPAALSTHRSAIRALVIAGVGDGGIGV